ncbi:MAG: ComEC/Rec2 family competence protein, partial [Clostridia bacterium]|nr:ComEC/Rec2 family competence protein [Clostridia bacterium]
MRHEFLLSHLFVFALSLALVSECVFTLPNLRREEAFSRTVSDGRQVDFIATVERGTEHGTLLRVEEAEGERVCAYALADLWQAEAGTRFRATAFFSEEEGEHVGELLRVCRGETLFRARIQTDPSRVEENTSLLSSFGKELSSRLDVAKCAGYLRAVLLADKSGVDPAFSEVLSASGSSHLLALSGLHLGILIGSLHFVLRALFVPRGVRVVLSVFFALFFLVLCSFPLSLLRAFWMLVVASLTEFLRLRQNSAQSLVCAAAIIVFFDAAALFDVGFLLSVFATLGILLFLPAVRESLENSRLWLFLSEKGRFFRFLRRVYAGAVYSFAASFAALTFTAPITLLVFGTFPLFSPLFGVLLVPLFTLLLNVAFLLALLLAAGLPMVHAVASLTDALCALFVQTAEFFSTVSPVLRVENEWAVWAGFS